MNLVLEQGGSKRDVEFEPGASILDILRREGISPDVSIIFLGDRPIPVDSEAEEGWVLRVVSVASGG